SVREFAVEMGRRESAIDVLVNNAGVFMCPEWQTADGFEMQFGTNHLGSFLLTLQLMPMLKRAPAARVVNLSSSAHINGQIYFDNINLRDGAYTPTKGYGQSKLANILFTRELAKRLGPASSVRVYALNPGVVRTDAQRHVTNAVFDWLMKRLFLTPEMGVQTSLYCTLDETLDNESGFYYENCKRVDHMIPEATDDKVAERLWDLSCDLVDLSDDQRRVYIACRDMAKAETAVQDIKAGNPGADITAVKLDLSSLASVREFAVEMGRRESAIDVLVNNAGVFMCPEWQTADGFEMQFG
ncbi:unnamed protein product, partial [Medioppia subpectinata]